MVTAGFLAPLRTEKIGPRRVLLTDDLPFRTLLFGRPGIFVAPRGFQSDLASIPRVAWMVFPPTDDYDPAAVIHDAAYGHALLTEHGDRVHVVKLWADRLFREALRACGVGPVRAALMYQAVHRFGNPDAHPLAANRLEPVA